jgi:hypothetical protein
MSTIALSRNRSYRHKSTKRAAVILEGREIYLGRYNNKSSRKGYDRRIGEWIAGGRHLPPAAG